MRLLPNFNKHNEGDPTGCSHGWTTVWQRHRTSTWLLGTRPSLSLAVHAHGCFIMNMFLFNTLLCIGNSLLTATTIWRTCGPTRYHRLTVYSMLMKPGFLRSSQYVLLETHLSLWLASTTFLEEREEATVVTNKTWKQWGENVFHKEMEAWWDRF